MELKVIAKIHTDFNTKFGVPRQSGIVDELVGTIVFEPEFRNADALRGIDGYSHLWLIWGFSLIEKHEWSPCVRPPRLGGNTRMGVFATRSPFRPNPIGLSSVRLLGIEKTQNYGTVLHVSGADLVDGTPIYDIKPYLPFTDSHSDAKGGFADEFVDYALSVNFPQDLLDKIPADKRNALVKVLQNDPRPSYQEDETRIYGFTFDNREIKFSVKDKVLTVLDID